MDRNRSSEWFQNNLAANRDDIPSRHHDLQKLKSCLL